MFSKIQTNTASMKNEHAIDYIQNSFSVIGIKHRRYRLDVRSGYLLLYIIYYIFYYILVYYCTETFIL